MSSGRSHDEPSFDHLEFHVDGIDYLESGVPDRDGLDAREAAKSR